MTTTMFQRLLDCGSKGLCLLQIKATKVLLNDHNNVSKAARLWI